MLRRFGHKIGHTGHRKARKARRLRDKAATRRRARQGPDAKGGRRKTGPDGPARIPDGIPPARGTEGTPCATRGARVYINNV